MQLRKCIDSSSDVNNGSTDACGITTLTLDKTSLPACVGANTVTLTVTDKTETLLLKQQS
jgi:hypothetical protein